MKYLDNKKTGPLKESPFYFFLEFSAYLIFAR